jgi:integrase
MARRVSNSNLHSRAARAGLKVRGKPHYTIIGKGLHLGYRKGKRGGTWVVRRYAGNSSYVVETIARADDIEDADGLDVLDFWQAQERARKLGGQPDRPSGIYKVADAVADYLLELEGRASYNDTKRRLEAYALPVFGETRVDKLTADAIREWHRDLAEAPKRVRTKAGARPNTKAIDLQDPDLVADAQRARKVSANRILGQLKAALNFAFTEGRVASDAEWRRVKPFKSVNKSSASYLTLAECKRLINAADPEFRLLARTLLETGARYSHVARLRVSDYHPDSGTIYLRTTATPGKQGEGFHIFLTEQGREFFNHLVAGRAGSELLLGREWKASEQTRPMKLACERAKIDPPVGIKQLRHTWASHAIMSGVPKEVVAKNMGHSDTRMVEKHYGHLAPNFVADQIRKAAPRFGIKDKSNVRSMT